MSNCAAVPSIPPISKTEMGIKIGEYKLYFNREVLKLILACQVAKRDCERSLMCHINTTKISKHEILEAMKGFNVYKD